jgi:hypothetical protein
MATEGKDREEIPVFTQFGKRNGHLNRNTRTVFFDAEKSSFKDLCTIQDFLTVVNFVFFRRSE